ncbi:MAG: heme-binding protein [Ruminococcus sp.]
MDTKVENSLISGTSDSVDEAVIQAVLRRMGMQNKITLDGAKKLIGKIEQEALRRGKKAVIAVCGPEGNPIAVHVMDGAFLVSFDVALKKSLYFCCGEDVHHGIIQTGSARWNLLRRR